MYIQARVQEFVRGGGPKSERLFFFFFNFSGGGQAPWTPLDTRLYIELYPVLYDVVFIVVLLLRLNCVFIISGISWRRIMILGLM